MKLLTVIGARPQFIKSAPVSRAIRKRNRNAGDASSLISEIIVHTGQHYDYMMSKVFFDELGIPEPDYNLGVGSGSHGEQTGEMLRRIEKVLLKEKPDMMMIYGDTNSTLASALAASKLHIPVAHVEAGLRSYNKRMPEEINRVLSDHVSALLFCPTGTAVMNLREEGFTNIVNQGRIIDDVSTVDLGASSPPFVLNIGDVMYDALLMSLEIAEEKSNIRAMIFDKGISRYCLATVHRAENTDAPSRFDTIVKSLIGISMELPVIWPVHPRTRKLLDIGFPALAKQKGLIITEPVGYFDMIMLEKNATVILTDSGGIQKEAYWLKTPCVTLRDETEWVETVACGCNTLAPAGKVDIADAFQKSIGKPGDYRGGIYGDGDASGKLVSLIRMYD